MNNHTTHFILVAVSWAIFTYIGHNSAISIGQGFARLGDYLTFGFSAIMFTITWWMAFKLIHTPRTQAKKLR